MGSRSPRGLLPAVQLSGCAHDLYMCLELGAGAGRIAQDFLFIPSGDVAGIARVEGKWMVLEVALGSTVLLLA